MLGFQDYAVAKWFYHLNAWVGSGQKFLDEALDQPAQLEGIFKAMDDFMTRYDEVDWSNGLVDDCKTKCRMFEHLDLHDHLVGLTSHIYTFQGFDAQHKISIPDLSKALDLNRRILEDFPKTKPGPTSDEKEAYNRFYNEERRFKCTRITCRYFSEGFKDEEARKRHVNIHERPFQCDIPDCLEAEGFANSKDLERHTRAFHPEMSDLAVKFISATVKRETTNHACSMCGKTFSRNFHRKNHELSHRGERPHECPECGKSFTRLNDLKRHQKIHDRKPSYASSSKAPTKPFALPPTRRPEAPKPPTTADIPALTRTGGSQFMSSSKGKGSPVTSISRQRFLETPEASGPALPADTATTTVSQSLPSTKLRYEYSLPIPSRSNAQTINEQVDNWRMREYEGSKALTTNHLESFSSHQNTNSYTNSSESKGDSDSYPDEAGSSAATSVESDPIGSTSTPTPATKDEIQVQRKVVIPGSSNSTPKDSASTMPANNEKIQRRATIPEAAHVVSYDLGTIDDDLVSVISNTESIGSQAGSLGRTPGERFASRLFGDFLGNLRQLRPLHEEALRRFGENRFVHNYRRLLKAQLLRLWSLSDDRTRTEVLTLRILRSRTSRTDIARNICRAIIPDESEPLEQHTTLDFRPREQENVAGWIASLRPTGSRDLDAVGQSSSEGSVLSEREEFNLIFARPQDRDTDGANDSDQADMLEDTSSEDLDSFEAELLSTLTEAYDFLRRDVVCLERDLRLLLLPSSLRDLLVTVPKDDIRILRDNNVSFVNQIKAFIEDHTQIEWDWWPLRPRSHSLSEGRQRLEWKVGLFSL
jgi:hypothetical protein